MFFTNVGKTPLDVFAVRDGVPKLEGELLPGALSMQYTVIGDTFEVAGKSSAARTNVKMDVTDPNIDAGIKKLVVCEEKPEEAQARVQCRTEMLRYRGDMWDRLAADFNQSCSQLLANHPEDVAYFCHQVDYSTSFQAQCRFDMSIEEFDWRSWFRAKRGVDDCARSVDHVPKFTKLGHGVSTIPADIFNELQTHWRQNRLKLAKHENHDKLDTVVNGCTCDSWLLRFPESLRSAIIRTLQPLVAEWGGLQTDDIEFVTMYGTRMYRHGSILAMHRDHMETHVLSAILEIGRLDMSHPDSSFNETQDWPLEILDHQRNLHKVPNKPGQMIFYESHTCPHGRPSMFYGREVANMFVHFKPKGWGPKDYELKQRHEVEL